MEILGIDIGGTGIKGAPVNTDTGELLAPRQRILTPNPAKPKPVAKVVAELANRFKWVGPIGIGFPAVVKHGVTLTAANVHRKWVDLGAEELLAETTHCRVHMINDADAAGMAEMKFGAGKGRKDLVLMITIGTGIGTALFYQGILVPNTELGHIEIEGEDAEKTASEVVRIREKLSWKKWSEHFNTYLQEIESLLWPDLIILGGGASKEAEKFLSRLDVRAQVVPAALLNEAGIVGAALAMEQVLLREQKKGKR